jgi:hypothetical protein
MKLEDEVAQAAVVVGSWLAPAQHDPSRWAG